MPRPWVESSNGSSWVTVISAWFSGLTDRTIVDGAVNLVGRIGSGENVQRPVPNRRAPQMRMVETDPVVRHQHDR